MPPETKPRAYGKLLDVNVQLALLDVLSSGSADLASTQVLDLANAYGMAWVKAKPGTYEADYLGRMKVAIETAGFAMLGARYGRLGHC